MRSSLHNPFIMTENAGRISYGGNQSWSQSKVVKKYGCGAVGGTDLLLYLSLHKSKCRTEMLKDAMYSGGIFSQEEYQNYVNLIRKRYLPVIPFFGMPGWMLAFGINRYLRHGHTGLKASWGVYHRNLWNRISAMLAHDIPVILAIGPNFPLVWKNHKLTLYCRNQAEEYLPACQVKAHYVSVTGMDDTWLRVSSWGKEYYINRNEYFTYAKRYSGFFVSNICYISSR